MAQDIYYDFTPSALAEYIAEYNEYKAGLEPDRILEELWLLVRSIKTDRLVDAARKSEVKGLKWLLDEMKQHIGTRRRYPNKPITEEWIDNALNHEDVLISLRLLVNSAIIDLRTAQPGDVSEREADLKIHYAVLKSIQPTLNIHYGEVESRASRERRIGSDVQKNVKGAYCDYLISDDSCSSTDGWGREFSVVANAGCKRNNVSKMVHDKDGLVTVLRDQHYRLGRELMDLHGGTVAIIRNLHMGGVLINRWTHRLFVVAYLRAGFYGVLEEKPASVPTVFSEAFPTDISQLMRFQYLYKAIVLRTKEVFDEARESEDTEMTTQTTTSSEKTSEKEETLPPPDHARTPKKK
ncbi:hypothetical protein HK104_004765 [Borealophlyctis nickersoniae]|nr:hypothetical protein HK104_004765 [Borealophlyctis nickersoniae]